MTVTLYQPGHKPQIIANDIFIVHPETGEIVQNAGRAGDLLGCAPGMVDVLACGKGYLIYSIFDYEGEVNHIAMKMLAELSGTWLNLENEDETLQGPVLVIQC